MLDLDARIVCNALLISTDTAFGIPVDPIKWSDQFFLQEGQAFKPEVYNL